MDAQTLWVGLDLGLRRTHLCIVDDEGAPLQEQECETSLSALQDAVAQFPRERIGLIAVEAGADTHIVRKLRGAGFPVAMFEARKASRFLAVRRNKTDTSDARGLADLARLGRNTISQVYLKSPACQQLRSQLALRKRLVMLRVSAEGALRSRLGQYGQTLSPAGRRWFERSRARSRWRLRRALPRKLATRVPPSMGTRRSGVNSRR